MRGRPGSVRSLEEFGRVRLSASFFMRDFLHSEIADFHGIPNIPDDPELAIAAGRQLCKQLLEPLRRPSVGSRSALPTARLRSTSLATVTGLAAPRTYAITAVISGTTATSRALWERWRPSSFHGLPIATATARIGAHSPGGSMTTCRTASFSSSQN
jgi:hypothetical protein